MKLENYFFALISSSGDEVCILCFEYRARPCCQFPGKSWKLYIKTFSGSAHLPAHESFRPMCRAILWAAVLLCLGVFLFLKNFCLTNFFSGFSFFVKNNCHYLKPLRALATQVGIVWIRLTLPFCPSCTCRIAYWLPADYWLPVDFNRQVQQAPDGTNCRARIKSDLLVLRISYMKCLYTCTYIYRQGPQD